MSRLVVVSNRVPSADELEPAAQDTVAVGGLVSAVKSLMRERGGLWLGWSGRSTARRGLGPPRVTRSSGSVELATIDLSEDETNLYYTGFSNRTLWPLLHSFTERTSVRTETYRTYRRINRRFADALYPLLRSDDLVWVHDFQLFMVGKYLRQAGWKGKLGFFLHVPFPAPEIFAILPWADEILVSLVSYDLIGVHTASYRRNLLEALKGELGVCHDGETLSLAGGDTRVGVHPIGVEPDAFRSAARSSLTDLRGLLSLPVGQEYKIIVGVDRLDYTKGIPEKLRAFDRLLERYPQMRGTVTLVQISNPSRTRVPEYAREREQVEMLVGQINGKFSDAGWVPVRYLYRSFSQGELAGFYHHADVGMVTPLRDGMNLIAKEFVASQGRDPGVLLLSKFTGAADELTDAVLVNPYDNDGTAELLYEALTMPQEERARRWKSLMRVVRANTAQDWGQRFRDDLVSV